MVLDRERVIDYVEQHRAAFVNTHELDRELDDASATALASPTDLPASRRHHNASARSLVRRPTFYVRTGKRLLDIALTLLVMIVALPTMSCVGIALRITLGRGVMFPQTRVGRDGVDFTMYKFRTMKQCRRQAQRPFDGEDRRRTHKHDEDPRHTSVGRALRKTSLDELPQLFNVLKGEMSLVGPRPEITEVVEKHSLRSHPRHAAMPGITGSWQTSFRNQGVMLHECFDHDLDYVADVRFSKDLSILFRTVQVLLAPGGR
jgi:lipopolysaccharide/colanic/teichoic acid biosynthesis glycosyltransferase